MKKRPPPFAARTDFAIGQPLRFGGKGVEPFALFVVKVEGDNAPIRQHRQTQAGIIAAVVETGQGIVEGG